MDETIQTLLLMATLLPLAASVLVLAAGKLHPRAAGLATTGLMAVAFGCSVAALLAWPGGDHRILWNLPWIPLDFAGADYLYLGAYIDGLTVAMMVLVTGIAALVHLYSIGYMAGDSRYHLFFCYLSLFTFSMLGIVISNSLIQLFVFWELVGLTSYLLIGFWHERKGPQLAARKAFVMNRIGDAGFLVGFGILFYQLGGQVLLPAAEGVTGPDGEPVRTMLGALEAVLAEQSAAAGLSGEAAYSLSNPPWWLTLAGIGLFCGAIGKSAQFPLQTWLPDAMEGPTPVSSIVHSATMVAAGVYLTARIYPILTPEAQLFIATIGLVTLVMAATMALVMTDIKRVLAYSTLSQLGYMTLAMGAGAWGFALLHLVTHAFFKCCLFQCAGSVIHAAGHEQDMRRYGGLGRKMPWTATAFGISVLAIAGASIPLTSIGLSGFYSKDGIIAGAINYGEAMAILGDWAHLFWIGPVVVAFITPLYMARAFVLTFLGEPRDRSVHAHAHEAPTSMLISQLVLAAMALVSGWWLFKGLIADAEVWVTAAAVQPMAVLSAYDDPGVQQAHALLLEGFAWILMLVIGWWLYRDGGGRAAKLASAPGLNLLHTVAREKYYFDALYDVFITGLTKMVAMFIRLLDNHYIDGLVNLAATAGRGMARAIGVVDIRVVDRAVDGAAEMATETGEVLRTTQAGRVRVYVLGLFTAAAIVLAVVVGTLLLRDGVLPH